jgi:phosphatidylglycerophosphate synthase
MSQTMTLTHTDLSRAARRHIADWPSPGPIGEFVPAAMAGAAVTLAVGAVLSIGGGMALPGLLASFAFYIAGATVAWLHLGRAYPHGTLGLCNIVTLLRLALTAALFAPLVSGGGAQWAIFATAALALSLDGVDGWLARRAGLVSKFGARFDMEVDSALALVLALLAWSSGSAGAVVLVLGVPRYLFAAAGFVAPWLRAPLPDRFSRKAVCVLQLGTLIAVQLPFVTQDMTRLAVPLVAAALAWSFGRDVICLWRARA